MPLVKRVVLDVLKPHTPGVLEFATAIAQSGPDHVVKIRVLERDEKTETVAVTIEGGDITLETVGEVISRLGGSVHSVDEVEATGTPPADGA